MYKRQSYCYLLLPTASYLLLLTDTYCYLLLVTDNYCYPMLALDVHLLLLTIKYYGITILSATY